MILGLLALLAGCGTVSDVPRTGLSSGAATSMQAVDAHQPQAREVSSRDDQDHRDREPESRSATPEAEPRDPGAAALVKRLAAMIDAEDDGRTAPVRIGTWSIRNHSRCQSDEFEAMQHRFAELLDHAADDLQFQFTADPARPVEYQLGGTAYIITAGGFDQWELYLTLRPADRSWTIWQAEQPVRMLRVTRRRGPQIFLPESP